MKTLALIFLILLGTTSAAYADCIYNGQIYPEGSRVGPFTCRNGAWVRL
ncbi:MAG: hypothetical protein CLLPBCKN_000445 [Chroococcidiopsis cubana SAG 39.79]|nr:hypothetical protein [Chroococcidiopsis cubana SAG 39.79]